MSVDASVHIRKYTLRRISHASALEACARRIAHFEGKDWGSLWTLTQESYRDEAETVCQNCYVGGSAPQTQKVTFHNLLTGAVRHREMIFELMVRYRIDFSDSVHVFRDEDNDSIL